MVPNCSLLQTMPSKLDKIQTITCAAAYWNHLQVRVPLIMVHWAIALTETHLGQKPVPFSSWEETLRSNERLAGPPCWSHPSLVMILVARSTVAAYIYIYTLGHAIIVWIICIYSKPMFHLFILQLLVLDSHIPHQRVGTVNDFHVTMYLYMYLNTTSKCILSSGGCFPLHICQNHNNSPLGMCFLFRTISFKV